MVKVKNAQPKNASGAYNRLFGNSDLGALISKVQSTVISAGKELEKIIQAKVKPIDDLDKFLDQEIMSDGVFLVAKKEIKRCEKLDFSGSEPDFIIFKRRDGKQHCHIVELKDGHVFDTKKAGAERQALHGFMEHNANRLPYTVSTHFCAFNQESRETIWNGFKRKIDQEEAMTGRELCELLEIDYDEIVKSRESDQEENIADFVKELLSIPEIRKIVEDQLREDS